MRCYRFEMPAGSNPEQLLKNIRDIQARNNIKQSENLVNHLGACSQMWMETGTGKTYVYIKLFLN